MKNSLILTLAMVLALASCRKSAADTATELQPAPQAMPTFCADSAYAYLARQVELGPRVPGTAAHAAAHDYLAQRLREFGAEVTLTDTTVTDPDGRRVPVRNIEARFNPEARRSVLLLAHYDTRPYADKDPDPANHSTPIDGANDGASGVAVLLEVARNISTLPDDKGYIILLVDAEDSGTYDGDETTWCLGSQLWASTYSPADKPITYGVLLDMVGGRDANFHTEYFSETYAPQYTARLRNAARRLGFADRFPSQIGGAINDDHIYIMTTGIPCIDIIESQNPETGSFNPTWHTLDDNLDNIDPATLRIVGQTLMEMLKN